MPDFTIPDAAAGSRLDNWLARQFAERSRTEVQRWIKEGAVLVDGKAAKPGLRLEAGQEVRVVPPEIVAAPTLRAEAITLDILYEDDDLLVVNKPAGMVVHPAPGHAGGTLVNAVMHHCPQIEGVGGERRPGIVHRLDKDTSGVIVVAKHDRALRNLQEQFKNRTVYKEYVALLEGRLEKPQGRIVAAIGRHPTARKRQAVYPSHEPVAARAREAVTEYHTQAVYSASIAQQDAIGHFTLVRAILVWRTRSLPGSTYVLLGSARYDYLSGD